LNPDSKKYNDSNTIQPQFEKKMKIIFQQDLNEGLMKKMKG
jgi:hypothetical protein